MKTIHAMLRLPNGEIVEGNAIITFWEPECGGMMDLYFPEENRTISIHATRIALFPENNFSYCLDEEELS